MFVAPWCLHGVIEKGQHTIVLNLASHYANLEQQGSRKLRKTKQEEVEAQIRVNKHYEAVEVVVDHQCQEVAAAVDPQYQVVVVVEDHQRQMVGIDGNVAELADMAVVVVAVVAAAEGQNSAQNENRDSLDYTSFQ